MSTVPLNLFSGLTCAGEETTLNAFKCSQSSLKVHAKVQGRPNVAFTKVPNEKHLFFL